MPSRQARDDMKRLFRDHLHEAYWSKEGCLLFAAMAFGAVLAVVAIMLVVLLRSVMGG